MKNNFNFKSMNKPTIKIIYAQTMSKYDKQNLKQVTAKKMPYPSHIPNGYNEHINKRLASILTQFPELKTESTLKTVKIESSVGVKIIFQVLEDTTVLNLKEAFVDAKPETYISQLNLFKEGKLLTDDILVKTLFTKEQTDITLTYMISSMIIFVDPFPVEYTNKKHQISVKINGIQYYLKFEEDEVWNYFGGGFIPLFDIEGNVVEKIGDDKVRVVYNQDDSTEYVFKFKVIVYNFPDQIKHKFGIFPSTNNVRKGEYIDFTYDVKGRINGIDCIMKLKFMGYQPHCDLCTYPTAWEVDEDSLVIVDLKGNEMNYMFIINDNDEDMSHHSYFTWDIELSNCQ